MIIRATFTAMVLFSLLLSFSCLAGLPFSDLSAEAAVSKGKNQQLESATTNQGGGRVSSQNFRQQASFGEAIAGGRISSSRFKVVPGFIGSILSLPSAIPKAELDMSVLYAKTAPLGLDISPKTWQKDNDPFFAWEPPGTGLDIAGYSYALDINPDDIPDTTDTSFDVATSQLGALADGKHTFAVKAVNTAGKSGKPVIFEFWIDTTPPQIASYAPSPGSLLNTINPSISATITDASSGIVSSGISVYVNGSSISTSFNEETLMLKASGGSWKEGANRMELRASDIIGNAHSPVIWSVTLDTQAPMGTVIINSGASMTSSIYVSLGLEASDAISGVSRMLISNEELTGYVEEPYASVRDLWKLRPIRGPQNVFVKFIDKAGNISQPVSAEIDVGLISPETVITGGPAGYTLNRSASFTFMCPEGDCLFSFAFDNDEWSVWSSAVSATKADLVFGNHYFRVKAAKEVNGVQGIQPDEEDASPAERTWSVGVQPSGFTTPKGPPIRLWRIE